MAPFASMVKLEDTLGLGPSEATPRVGSSPTGGIRTYSLKAEPGSHKSKDWERYPVGPSGGVINGIRISHWNRRNMFNSFLVYI